MKEKRYIDVKCFENITTMVDEEGEAYVPVSAIRKAIATADSITVKFNEEEGDDLK